LRAFSLRFFFDSFFAVAMPPRRPASRVSMPCILAPLMRAATDFHSLRLRSAAHMIE
jgi:hypothetical protein